MAEVTGGLWAARRRQAGRSARVALLVGPLLFGVNHLDALANGRWPRELGIKLAFTFLVPFCVSYHSGRAAARGQQAGRPANEPA